MHKEMRRGEKAIPQEEIMEILENAEFGVLSTISTDNTAYAVPLNFAYKDGALYFHSALEGHKIENIKANSSACFNVVDSVVLMPEKFNTQYRSVTLFGTMTIVEDTEEKKKGITAIAEKLSPDYKPEGREYIEKAFNVMHVLKLDIERMTGKATRG